jgi:hypothetical protein
VSCFRLEALALQFQKQETWSRRDEQLFLGARHTPSDPYELLREAIEAQDMLRCLQLPSCVAPEDMPAIEEGFALPVELAIQVSDEPYARVIPWESGVLGRELWEGCGFYQGSQRASNHASGDPVHPYVDL